MRSLFPLAALALALATASPSKARLGQHQMRAGTPAPAVAATIACEKVAEPGRVRCEVEARAAAGRVVKWADVVVIEAPPFATALRARVGPLEATTREDGVWRWALALAAKARGTGEIRARVRAVTCAGQACEPSETEIQGDVVVGP